MFIRPVRQKKNAIDHRATFVCYKGMVNRKGNVIKMSGLFISLEGPDGSGKSTQIALLRAFLEQQGYSVLETRDPGGTKISEQIRSVILNRDNTEMSNMTELLLYTAARAQMVDELIRPALAEGKVVISDRFLDSAAVYQGMVRGLGTKVVYDVNEYALRGLLPQVTFLLDLPAQVGIQRKNQQHELDRMELEKAEFHEQVAKGYRLLAKEQPERIMQIDAMRSREEISKCMIDKVKELLS